MPSEFQKLQRHALRHWRVPFPQEPSERILGYPAICANHCTVCEGQDHHWMPDCDEETGEPVMVCKHCDAQREFLDKDEP